VLCSRVGRCRSDETYEALSAQDMQHKSSVLVYMTAQRQYGADGFVSNHDSKRAVASLQIFRHKILILHHATLSAALVQSQGYVYRVCALLLNKDLGR
jgi:hypothetical protein